MRMSRAPRPVHGALRTIARRRLIAGAAATAAVAALGRSAVAGPARGHMDPAGRFGSLLDQGEFERAPRPLSPAILSQFASQAALRGIVKSGPARRHVLTGLPPVMMQGTNGSLGFPGSCEADSFGYCLGGHTAARGVHRFNPDGGPANEISAAWLFSWAQRTQDRSGCGGSLALPYVQLLVAEGAPNARQVPYHPMCPYISGLNTTNVARYAGIDKFVIGSYKAFSHVLHAQATYLPLFKQFISADHAVAFSGLVAQGYDNPGTAMTKGAFAPTGFIPKSGHGQVIVGYDDALGAHGAFLVQNSFGTAWPYFTTKDSLMHGRLWWSYESFFASQSYAAIAYPVPANLSTKGAVTLGASANGVPAARVLEAHRGTDNGQSVVALELSFSRGVQLNTVRVTPPGSSAVEESYDGTIRYGFARVGRPAAFPSGRYAVELEAQTVGPNLETGESITYEGQVTIA